MGRREQFTVGRLDVTDSIYLNGTALPTTVLSGITADAAEINKLDGLAAVIAAGAAAHAHIADAKADYVSPDLDTEAELIVALNALGTTINAILVALETFGINASA